MGYFGMKHRKDGRGHIVDWQPQIAVPLVDIFPSYLFIETTEAEQIKNFYTTLGFEDIVDETTNEDIPNHTK